MDWLRFGSAAYWTCFVAAFLAVAMWESIRPKRNLSQAAERRWRNHGALLVFAVIAVTLLLRAGPIVMSTMVAGSRFGVLNKPWAPLLFRCGAAVLLMDLAQYWIHRSVHRFPWLWRVHSVHHSDSDYDVSTAGRFHPLEELYSQGIRLGVVALLAPPVAGVFAAEVLTASLNLIAHANASFPPRVEKVVRAVFITPDLHRIHHSLDSAEQQRNLGQTFSWWDRCFGTYVSAACAEESDFRTGLKEWAGYDTLGIGFMLAEPFQTANPETGPDSRT